MADWLSCALKTVEFSPGLGQKVTIGTEAPPRLNGPSQGGAPGGEILVKAKVHVTLKNGVLDPQGKAVQHALAGLGFDGVEDVRQGKFIELELSETDPVKAAAQAEEMCKKLLANTVIENYAVEIE